MTHRIKNTSCDHLIAAFEEACDTGSFERSSSLLADIDQTLLGAKQSSAQREAALRRMRALRARLDPLRPRPEAPMARMARVLFG